LYKLLSNNATLYSNMKVYSNNSYKVFTELSKTSKSHVCRAYADIYYEKNHNPQLCILFSKRKYGLFKTQVSSDKRLKFQLINIMNILKNQENMRKNSSRPRPKVIFSKKLNRFFFRAGRNTFMQNFNHKKYLIQKYITKKIFNITKKPATIISRRKCITDILLNSNLFYSYNDSSNFVKYFGVLVGSIIIYDPVYTVNAPMVFSLRSNYLVLSFFVKKKSLILASMKKIKFYKYRSKLYTTAKSYVWVPTKNWVREHIFLCINRLSNYEVDYKILSGVILYNDTQLSSVLQHNIQDISLYMNRSYTWKYLT